MSKKNETGKEMLDRVKKQTKDKLEAEKQPKTVKVTTLLGWAGVVAIVVGAYIMGSVMADVQHVQYRHEVLTEAKQIVDSLKSKR